MALFGTTLATAPDATLADWDDRIGRRRSNQTVGGGPRGGGSLCRRARRQDSAMAVLAVSDEAPSAVT